VALEHERFVQQAGRCFASYLQNGDPHGILYYRQEKAPEGSA